MKNQSNNSHRLGDDRFNTAGPTTDETTTKTEGSRSKSTSSSKISTKKDTLS